MEGSFGEHGGLIGMFEELNVGAAGLAFVVLLIVVYSLFMTHLGWEKVALWVRLGILFGAPVAAYLVADKMSEG